MASLRTITGGEIVEYTQMLDQSRREALDRLKQHAKSLGANAVIEVRFDSSRDRAGNVRNFSIWYCSGSRKR